MKTLSLAFLSRAFVLVGLAILGLQLPAMAQLSVDLGIDSGTTVASPAMGAAHTYVAVTLTVTNYGPDSSSGPVITVYPEKGLKILPDVNNYCTVSRQAQGNHMITCDLSVSGPLPPPGQPSPNQESVTIYFESAQSSPYQFQLYVSGPENDPNPDNNHSSIFLNFT